MDGLEGGAGDDRLNGGPDGDGLSGGAGDDILTGGRGQDFMSGGPGADRFLFFGDAERGYDSGVGEDEPYQINDLTRGDDRIDLRGVDAVVAQPGRQTFRFVGHGAFSAPGQVRYRFTRSGSVELAKVFRNVDADPLAESIVRLYGRLPLRPGDFVLRDPITN